jgi:hypothetical protein
MPIVAPVDMSSLNLHNVADPAATSDASTMRRIGSYQNTDNSVVMTTEVLLGSFTVALSALRRYRLSISGSINTSEDNATVAWFQCRYASGGTVTTAGTQLLVVEQANTHGWNQACSNWKELPPGTFTTGTYTLGLTVARAAGTGTTKYGGGAIQPAILDLYDVGT